MTFKRYWNFPDIISIYFLKAKSHCPLLMGTNSIYLLSQLQFKSQYWCSYHSFISYCKDAQMKKIKNNITSNIYFIFFYYCTTFTLQNDHSYFLKNHVQMYKCICGYTNNLNSNHFHQQLAYLYFFNINGHNPISFKYWVRHKWDTLQNISKNYSSSHQEVFSVKESRSGENILVRWTNGQTSDF